MKMLLRMMLIVIVCAAFAAPGCGGGDGAQVTPTSFTVKLIKTDGTEVDTTARPIPLGTTIQITFEEAILEQTAKDEIVAALALLGPSTTEVDGTWAWNEASTQLTFTPTTRLAYQTEYTLTATAPADTTSSVGKALEEGSFPFTTMTRGDVDGDGFAELVAGAPYWDPSGSALAHGAFYVFNGSASGITTPYTSRVVGSAADEFFGLTWATADFNGDGYADLIIGAPGDTPGVSDPNGAAHVYYGSSGGIPATPSISIAGQDEETLAWSLDTAGDVNGDGFDDAVIGAPTYNDGSNTNAGRAALFYGSADGISSTPSAELMGSTTESRLGFSVGAAGDVNGDGIDDIVVGGNPDVGTGSAYVYLGSTNGIGTAPATSLAGENANDGFGFPTKTIGDVNGDGYDDIIIGATGYDVIPLNDEGAVYIYYGSSGGIPTTYDKRIAADTDKTGFGYAASAAGDINGDGYDDFIVGAPTYNSETGRAYVYNGSAAGVGDSPNKTITGSTSGDLLGLPLPGVDYDGDGYPDSAIGAPGYDSDKGAAYLYYGSASGLGDTPGIVTGEQADDMLTLYLPF